MVYFIPTPRKGWCSTSYHPRQFPADQKDQPSCPHSYPAHSEKIRGFYHEHKNRRTGGSRPAPCSLRRMCHRKKRLHYCVSSVLEPFSSKNIVTGEPYGIDIDIINWIANDQGFDVTYTYIYVLTSEFLDKLDAEALDVATGKVIIEERLKRCDSPTSTTPQNPSSSYEKTPASSLTTC